MAKPRVIYWFRTDLRLHDSPALKAALDLDPECVWPVWCWDPHYVYRARVGPNRWRFLLDCMQNVSENITKLNATSKLYVLREAPQTLFKKLFRAWGVTHLVFEKDTDGYARRRDEEVMQVARDAGVQVVVRYGRTLWDPDRLVEVNGGRPTMTIMQVQHAGAKIGQIPRPIPAPTSLPGPGQMSLDFGQDQPAPEPDFNAIQRTEPDQSYVSIAGPNGDFAVPTMEELGLLPATSPHRGGETLALGVLDAIISNETYTATFEKPKTAPSAFSPQATTLLSPHIHFGALSVRLFYWRAQDVVSSYRGQASTPPTSLTGQLLFRDMYFGAQASLGYTFSQTFNNPIARFIPWHLPSKIDPDTKLITGEYTIDSPAAQTHFLRWKYGRTGFPWVDALMRQLRHEGWIHHLGRHMVACFLTRGGCYVDWERGAEVFEEWLIDHETASNTGNWQWLSCVAFFNQFYRCYSPVAHGKGWDKQGAFVRRFVPELRNYDAKFIYEPWKAPIADQKRWGCLVKGDGGAEAGTLQEDVANVEGGCQVYPKPMFDFAKQKDVCLNGMKKAYAVGLRGSDERVLNGTWRSLFEDGAEGPTKGTGGLPGAMVDARAGVDEDDEELKYKSSRAADPVVKRKREASARGQMKLDHMIKRAKK